MFNQDAEKPFPGAVVEFRARVAQAVGGVQNAGQCLGGA